MSCVRPPHGGGHSQHSAKVSCQDCIAVASNRASLTPKGLTAAPQGSDHRAGRQGLLTSQVLWCPVLT